jgi:hypothetical protein
VPGGKDAEAVARFDETLPAVGSKIAYTILIHANGLVEQSLPFDRIGWHAKSYSRTHIGIACFGDFRTQVILQPQWESLREVLVWCSLHHGHLNFFGHTEKPDATSYDPGAHDCPGQYLDMDKLRYEVKIQAQELAECLPNPGFVLESK